MVDRATLEQHGHIAIDQLGSIRSTISLMGSTERPDMRCKKSHRIGTKWDLCVCVCVCVCFWDYFGQVSIILYRCTVIITTLSGGLCVFYRTTTSSQTFHPPEGVHRSS